MASAPLTLAQFKVDLGQLEEAIGTVQTQATLIGFRSSLIAGTIQGVPANGVSAGVDQFAEMAGACVTRMTALNDLLTEMIRRMRIAYDNYQQAEEANIGNFRQ
jgi:hypothetical protein